MVTEVSTMSTHSPGSALAKMRWKKTPRKQRAAIASALGLASAASLTAEQRTARARKAGLANAKNRRAAKNAAARKSNGGN